MGQHQMASRLLDIPIYHQDLQDRPHPFMLTTFPNLCSKSCARMELPPPTLKTRLPEVPLSPIRVNFFTQTQTHQCFMLSQRKQQSQKLKRKKRDQKISIQKLFINQQLLPVCLDLLLDLVKHQAL